MLACDITHNTDVVEFRIHSGIIDRDIPMRFEKHEDECWHPVVPYLEEKIIERIEASASRGKVRD